MTDGGEFWTSEATAADDLPVRWQQMLSATHLPWAVQSPMPRLDRGFQATVHRRWIDDLALVDCVCSPCSGSRQRRELADTVGEFVVLLITRAGCETVSQGRSEASLRPGDAVVWDSTRSPRFTVWQPLAKRSLLIPRAALDEVSGGAWDKAGTVLQGSSSGTRLLIEYIELVSATLSGLSPAAITGARNAILELFAGVLRVDPHPGSSGATRSALRSRIDRYIERHLLDGDVTTAALAAVHGVSCRTVNRVFSDSGQTLGEAVRVRRLARARDELVGSDELIGTIAHRWKFSDSSHFSRSFADYYGSPPSDYRELARKATPPHSPEKLAHTATQL